MPPSTALASLALVAKFMHLETIKFCDTVSGSIELLVSMHTSLKHDSIDATERNAPAIVGSFACQSLYCVE